MIRRRIGNSTSTDRPDADDTGLRPWCARPSRRGQSVYCPALDGCARGDNAHQKQESPGARRRVRLQAYHRVSPTFGDFLETAEQSKRVPMPYYRQFFIPAIITTARLFVCHFDPADVSPET